MRGVRAAGRGAPVMVVCVGVCVCLPPRAPPDYCKKQNVAYPSSPRAHTPAHSKYRQHARALRAPAPREAVHALVHQHHGKEPERPAHGV
ncbi:hypothetical protein B0H14DRAFT_2956233, partial [Mycena olivaceomarginata]